MGRKTFQSLPGGALPGRTNIVLTTDASFAAPKVLPVDDWFLLKLQEELGELAQAHLRLSSRGRGQATEQDRADEAADVLCMLLLYCRRFGIDPDAAVRRKWLSWLEPAA